MRKSQFSGVEAFILVAAIAAARCQTSGPVPAVAFASGNSILLVSKTGETISTIKLPIRVGEFAFSPDLRRLVVVSLHPGDESGGKMYLYTPESKQIQRIPAQAVSPEESRSEVYSDPQFSPDGSKLLFIAHPQAGGDLFETSGPIAELDVKSFRARVLPSTTGSATTGPDDTDGAKLSPNGREILLWDLGIAIDTKGTILFDLHDFQLDESFHWASDVAWVGNSCVLYKAGKLASHYSHPYLKDQISFFVLHLKNLKSTSASETLGLSDRQLDGLVAYRYPYALIKSAADAAGNRGEEYFLVSSGGMRTKVAPGSAAIVQILPNNAKDDSPSECR